MTLAQQQFLELLRSGLWGIPADTELFKEKVDWASILRIAMQQAVQVVVADGIETLPKDMWPPKEAVYKLMMVRIKTEQMHSLLNSTLNQIVNALKEENIPSVLLKGQGVAQNYRKPTSRMCGDIDLYTGLGGYEQTCKIIEKLQGDKPHKEGEECEHHMHLSLNGVDVEVHRYADMMPSQKLNKSIQKWNYDSIDAHFGSDTLRTWDNQGTDIHLATPTFDAFFILHHAVRHMTTEGVGFRQICDWTMYLHKNHQSIDLKELSQKLKEFHMEAIWKEFGILAVTALGLPKEELPLAPIVLRPTRKTSELLRHIFISGNFGRHDANGRDYSSTTYIKRKWRSFRFQSMRLIKLFNLFPRYSTSYAMGWFTEAILRFLKSK